MTDYLLSMYYSQDPQAVPANIDEIMSGVAALNEEIREAGAWVHTGGLESASNAKVVSASDDGPLIIDGPYLETKEALGGFWIIAADSVEGTTAWAAKLSNVVGTPIEVRAVQGS